MIEEIKLVRNEWNKPVSEAQNKMDCHAPVEMNDTPKVIHRDLGMLYFHMLNEELREYREAVQDEDLTQEEKLIQIADALIDIQYVLNGAIAAHGLTDKAEALFKEVHRSNLTKIKDGNVVLNEDGKVMKRKDDYEAPFLSKILFEGK